MLRNALIRLLINSAALWVADVIFSGIHFRNYTTLLIAAIIFGLLNALVKPVLIILTLPVNILTLGIFTLVINGLILKITSGLLDGFYIDDFVTAFFAAIFISLVSILLNKLLIEKS
ncbi:MAG: phage holin family protein [Calditrichaceae bacterium]|nr:phage holin family protein [Calditrichaceae bacterium]MBN2707734.1 phage holin family protein [Calditrichaceae bacterium]RQV96451.1 MAG: phage holin family protein [Calditrichota bacterium]